MAFRSKETMKKILKKVGEDNITRGVKEALSRNIPNNKVVMGRAKRGLFAGRHIQYGNQVSEDGGNNIRKGYHEKRGLSGRSDPARKEGAARKKHPAHVQAFKENVGWKLCVGDYVVVAVYTARSRRTWKPNVQEKRLFSYILDRHIRVHVTTHALRCIDKAGGIDEYLLKTPYHKMDTEMGLLWKAKIEKMYEELGKVEVSFFSPEDEAKFEQSFKEMKLDEKTARREFRRQLYGRSSTPEATSDPKDGESDGGGSGYGSSHSDHEQLVANA